MQTLSLTPGTGQTLPLYLSEVPAGFPSPADDYVESKLDLERLLVKRPAATFIVRARGDSMFPAVKTGDLLIVDRSVKAEDGHIVIAVISGELTVKHLRIREGKAALVPANPKYPVIIPLPEEEFRLWGVVTYIVRDAHDVRARRLQ